MRGRQMTGGAAPKSPNNITSTSFSTVHLLLKDIRFEHRGTKFAYCPGRHLASLQPWVRWVLQQIISLPYPVTSHWWVSMLDRCYMKTWNSTLKLFTKLKLIKSHDNYFLLLWNNVYEIFGTNHRTSKRWPMGPLQLSLPPPLAQIPSYATGCSILLCACVHGVNTEFSQVRNFAWHRQKIYADRRLRPTDLCLSIR